MNAVAAIAGFTLLEARRTRAWLGALVVVALSMALAELAAALALTESASYRSGIYAALVRLACVLVTMLFVAQSVARELADRLIDLTLGRAVARTEWYCGRLGGCAAAAVLLALLATLPLIAGAPVARALAWGGSLAMELVLVAAVCLTCTVTLRQVTLAVTATSAFYLLARAIDAMVLMSQGPTADLAQWSGRAVAAAVALVALVLPSLDRYARADWLHDAASAPALGPLAIECAVFVLLVAAIGLVDFHRAEL
ncbi:MAG: ABC transporter permease [Gammaproteobacteria bacterium]